MMQAGLEIDWTHLESELHLCATKDWKRWGREGGLRDRADGE